MGLCLLCTVLYVYIGSFCQEEWAYYLVDRWLDSAAFFSCADAMGGLDSCFTWEFFVWDLSVRVRVFGVLSFLPYSDIGNLVRSLLGEVGLG